MKFYTIANKATGEYAEIYEYGSRDEDDDEVFYRICMTKDFNHLWLTRDKANAERLLYSDPTVWGGDEWPDKHDDVTAENGYEVVEIEVTLPF